MSSLPESRPIASRALLFGLHTLALLLACLSVWKLSHWLVGPSRDFNTVPLTHLLIGAYASIALAFLPALAKALDKANMKSGLLLHGFVQYCVLVLGALAGMAVVFFYEVTFQATEFNCRTIGISGAIAFIWFVIWFVVRAYSKFVNKHL